MGEVEFVVSEDGEEAARRCAELLAEASSAGGHVVLTGGSTPRRAYELAATLNVDWGKAEVWWGDERCVPPDDKRSNYRLARESLFDRLARPPAVVHRIRGELDPEKAADLYDQEVRGVTFDLILLGLGADGHTASLFPNAPALEERERAVVAAEPGLDPRVMRVTMTIPTLEGGRTVVFLAVGEEKAEAVERAFAQAPDPATPASLVRSRAGRTLALLDRASASRLPRDRSI